MSETERVFARVIGTGSTLPGDPVSNEALAARLAEQGIETSDEWIVSRTGIRQRHFASEADSTVTLGEDAARKALDAAGLAPTDIDLIIVATSTPDMIFPSTACLIQGRLGASNAAAFDIQAVCTGFLYALVTAEQFIRGGSAKRALVIGADVFSRILDFNDRGTCVLFGDGSGAMVLEASNEPGVVAHKLHADGSQAGVLWTNGRVQGGRISGHPFLTMNGQAVFKLAVGSLESVALEVLSAAGMAAQDLDLLIPHQANIRILQATAKKLGVPEEKLFVAVDRQGNTSAASVPLAFDEAVRTGRLQRGHHVMVQGVGGGFTWGAALIRY